MSFLIPPAILRTGVSHFIGPVRSHVIFLRKVIPILIGLSTIATIGYAVIQGSLAVAVAYILFGLIGLVLVGRDGRSSIELFLLGYSIVNLFSVILYFVYMHRYGLPYFSGGSDDLEYERNARLIYNHGLFFDSDAIKLTIGNPFHNSTGYIYVVNVLMHFGEMFGGFDTMLPKILNGAVLGLISVFVRRIGLQIQLTNYLSLIAGIWASLFPMMFYTASHSFRDILTVFLIVFTVFCTLKIKTLVKVKSIWNSLAYSIIVVICIILMLDFRFLNVIPMTLMLLSRWVYIIFPIKRFRLRHVILFIALITSFFYFANEIDIFNQGVLIIQLYSESLGSGVQSQTDGLSILLFNLPQPLQTVARFFYALVTPLPVPSVDVEKNILGVGTLVQFYFSVFVILGIGRMWRNPNNLPILLGFLIFFYSYMIGSFTFRHVTQWFPFAVLIGIIGYENYKAYSNKIYSNITMFFIVAAFSYILMKLN